MKVQIRRVAVDQIIDLRHRILRAGLPRDTAHFDGDDARGTLHVAAFIDGAVIGCATALKSQWEGAAALQVRGMAVDLHRQKLGIGRQLLDDLERYAGEVGVKLLWANCRSSAGGFYRKLGWEKMSEEFQIPTAGPHYKMIKKLA